MKLRIKENIPNFLTCLNLASGCIAITFISGGRPVIASFLVLLAAFFDLLDGMVARLLNVSSPIGKELDSLADLVSFGVVPGYLVYVYFLAQNFQWDSFILLPYIAFLTPVFSGVRLAKFNIDTRQEEHFRGLPVPTNALLWISIPLIAYQYGGFETTSMQVDQLLQGGFSFIVHPIFLLGGTLVTSYLMVSNIPLFALKFKHLKWSGNEVRFIFILSSVILFGVFIFKAIPMIVLLYLTLSLFQNIRSNEVSS